MVRQDRRAAIVRRDGAATPALGGALTLEPQTAAHAEEMFALLCDPKIYRYEGEPPPSLDWLRERFGKLESRRSPDGREKWLNWVIRLESGEAAGYVQATVHEDGHAGIAYVLGSRFWDKGIGRTAVSSLMNILQDQYGVRRFTAVLKRANARSRLLLERLGFSEANFPVESDELGMELKTANSRSILDAWRG